MGKIPCEIRGVFHKRQMVKLFNYLLVLNVFLGGFVLFVSPFEFYAGYIFVVLFLMVYALYYDYVGINYKFLLFLSVLTVFSLVNVYLNNTTILLISKQLIGILITGSAYYLLIKVNKCDIENIIYNISSYIVYYCRNWNFPGIQLSDRL